MTKKNFLWVFQAKMNSLVITRHFKVYTPLHFALSNMTNIKLFWKKNQFQSWLGLLERFSFGLGNDYF